MELAVVRENWPRPPSRGIATGRAILDKTSAYIPDVFEDSEYPLPTMASAIGYRSILSVPMLRDDRPLGVITITAAQPRVFSPKLIALLQTFADQAVIAIENARLFEEVQARTRELVESLEYQTATSEVLSVISRSPSELQPVVDAIVQTAKRLCSAERAAIWRWREGKFDLLAHTITDPALAKYLKDNPIPSDSASLAGRAVLEGRTMHVPDLKADPELGRQDQIIIGGIRTLLVVPLLRKGEPIGVLSLSKSEVQPFSEKQIELVTTFADQAVIAIENTRLFEAEQASKRELQESLEYQTATSEVLGVISRSTFELQPILEAVVESATRLCGASRGHIFRVDGEYLRFAAAHGAWPGFTEYLESHPTRPGRGGASERAALERRTVHISDVLLDPDYQQVDLIKQQGYRTVLAVPMLREGTLLGIITILKSRVEPFSDKQIALVETFADQAVIAIENARLFEAEQASKRELQDSLEYQTATSEVLNVISRSPTDVQPVFDTIARSALNLCAGTFSSVLRFDGRLIHFVAAHGMTSAGFEALRSTYPLPPGRAGATTRAIETGALVEIPDIHADPDFEHGHVAAAQNFRSLASVLMLKDGQPIGTIT